MKKKMPKYSLGKKLSAPKSSGKLALNKCIGLTKEEGVFLYGEGYGSSGGSVVSGDTKESIVQEILTTPDCNDETSYKVFDKCSFDKLEDMRVILQGIKDEQDIEYIGGSGISYICVDNGGSKSTQAVRLTKKYDSETGIILEEIVEYSQDTISWTTTTPTGTISLGACGLAPTYIITITPRCYTTPNGAIQVVGFEKRLESDNSIVYKEYEVILSTDAGYSVGDILTDTLALTQTNCVSCGC